MSEALLPWLEPLAAVIAALGVIVTLLAALRSGAIKRLAIGPVSIERSEEVAQARALIDAVRQPISEAIPFETEQLARYYGQVLAQSKISFWFSLLFASLGFFVIIAAALLYSNDRQGSTIVSFLAGIVIDAVAALFFVQSRNAQKALGDFFDKLRTDKQQAESRTLCEAIEDSRVKDALRVELSLYYAGIGGEEGLVRSILGSQGTRAEVAGKDG